MNAFKSLTMAITMALVVTGLTSCGNGIPMGDDSKVKDQVKQILKMELQGKAASEAYQLAPTGDAKDEFNIMKDVVRFEFSDEGSVDDVMAKFDERYQKKLAKYDAGTEGSEYKKFAKQIKEYYPKYKPIMREMLEKYRSIANDMDLIKIKNIRTISKDEDAKMSVSAANVHILDKVIDVSYAAQRTSEGDVLVEVTSKSIVNY